MVTLHKIATNRYDILRDGQRVGWLFKDTWGWQAQECLTHGVNVIAWRHTLRDAKADALAYFAA